MRRRERDGIQHAGLRVESTHPDRFDQETCHGREAALRRTSAPARVATFAIDHRHEGAAAASEFEVASGVRRTSATQEPPWPGAVAVMP